MEAQVNTVLLDLFLVRLGRLDRYENPDFERMRAHAVLAATAMQRAAVDVYATLAGLGAALNARPVLGEVADESAVELLAARHAEDGEALTVLDLLKVSADPER